MYYLKNPSPGQTCAQWSELRLYYTHALKQLPDGELPTLKNLLSSYSHFVADGMEPMHRYQGGSMSFYFLNASLKQMKRLHLYMFDHGILKTETGSPIHKLILSWKQNLPTLEELKQPYIDHYLYVFNHMNADPHYGIRRSDYFSTPGPDGFVPKHLNFNILFDGLAELKKLFGHKNFPNGYSNIQVELGYREAPLKKKQELLDEKIALKNNYAERPDKTFRHIHKQNPHTRYPSVRLFEKDLLRIHRRVRKYTHSYSVHHYVREFGFSCNSWDKHYWEEYFTKYTFTNSFDKLVSHLDKQMQEA